MKKYIPAVIIFSFFIACQSAGNQEKLAGQIQSIQKEIAAESRPSPEKLAQFKAALENYAASYPEDSLSAKYLAEAGETARLLLQFDEAVKIYDRIIARHPQDKEAGKALFMKGFTYENDLKNLDSAKIIYTMFLEKYPQDDFADDAQFLLKNLGKKPEDILKEFEK